MHGYIHGRLGMMFHGMLEVASSPPLKVGLMQVPIDHIIQTIGMALWMRIEGPHNYKFMELGSCVK